MNNHEREYFISQIRSGKFFINHRSHNFIIISPTLDEEFFIQDAYHQSYINSLNDGVMTQDDMKDWMSSKGFWTDSDEAKLNDAVKGLDNLKALIYDNREDEGARENYRKVIRATEKHIAKLYAQKNKYHNNTCEGIAEIDKIKKHLELCTFESLSDLKNGKRYLFDHIGIEQVLYEYNALILTESQIRELARNEPWRTIWSLKDTHSFNLFNNNGRELTVNQRAILVWSKIYSNIHESPDCPVDSVLNDDDQLDGWFVKQKRKKEKERTESDVDSSIKNDKIRNSNEVFIMAKNKKHAQKINDVNDPHNKMVKQERMQLIKQRGSVKQAELPDERLKIQQISNEKFKEHFRR